MNNILLVYDGKEIIITTRSEVEEVVSFLNINSDEQFVTVESIDGKIGLNPSLVTLIKDVTPKGNFNLGKDLKCNINVDAEKLSACIKDILRKEFSEALGN